MWQTSFDGLTENICQHLAKSKISPAKYGMYHTYTHMIYHVAMEIGLGIKQSKHVYTAG